MYCTIWNRLCVLQRTRMLIDTCETYIFVDNDFTLPTPSIQSHTMCILFIDMNQIDVLVRNKSCAYFIEF